MKNRVYGYCRISRKQQNIERQERNILSAYPEAYIVKEAYTGTKVEGRKCFERILKDVQKGDTIVFDSVSRMSRNAAEGIELYFQLYNKGVNLVFLKERHIDTESYKNALEKVTGTYNVTSDGSAEGNLISSIMSAINDFMIAKASDDIRKAFDQAEKEVTDLHERTKEGMETARRNGKQIGRTKGTEVVTKKEMSAIEQIKKHSKDFGGSLSDPEVIKLCGISRNSYYKYKKKAMNAC